MDDPARWRLTLYLLGETAPGVRALDAVRELCEHDLGGKCELEVVDIMTAPERAEADRIMATPTLIKTHPAPTVRLVGDLSDRATVLRHLGAHHATQEGPT